jgi:hypothetical protein
MEDTIYEYYELLYRGKLEESEEILEWNHEEASVIDYFSSINKLATQHRIKRIKDLVILSINEADGKGEATVNIIYVDRPRGYHRSKSYKVCSKPTSPMEDYIYNKRVGVSGRVGLRVILYSRGLRSEPKLDGDISVSRKPNQPDTSAPTNRITAGDICRLKSVRRR